MTNQPYNVLSEKPENKKVLHSIGGVQMRFLGLDIANSYVKMWGDFGKMVYPNTTKNLTEKAKALHIREHEDLDEKTVEDFVFTYTDSAEDGSAERFHYQIGLTEKGLKTSFAKDSKRYFNPLFKTEFILAVASVASNGDNFAICTGLPSEHFGIYSIEDHIKNFAGTYTVERDGNPITFTIHQIHVELQPRGTYLSTVFKVQDGIIVDRNLDIKAAKYVGILDGGFGSTDFAYFVKNSKGRNELKDKIGIPAAMSNAYSLLVDNLTPDYPAISKMDLIEVESELRHTNKLYVAGQEIPSERLKAEVDKAFGKIATDIAAGLGNKVEGDTLNYLIFTGGAMLALRPYIRDLFDGSFRKVIVVDPQVANAEGYYIRLHILKRLGKLNPLTTGAVNYNV